jgi:3-dehydroquinate dehydratase-1
MRVHESVKERTALPLLVAVISSGPELDRAARLRQMPDFFELRLDALLAVAEQTERALAGLRAPLIITARHPREGGENELSTARRRDLLLRFLPHAAFVDVELRSVTRLGSVLAAAKHRQVRRIISVHELRTTPPLARLQELARAAEESGADIFKIATRTDTPAELELLLRFLDSANGRIPISAMGIGRLGRMSRRLLAARGSALNYAHLGNVAAEGQLSLAAMRRAIASARAPR